MASRGAHRDAAARFYELVQMSTSVRVVQGSFLSSKRKHDRELFVEKRPDSLLALQRALVIRPLGEGLALMSAGDPTLALYSERELLLTVQYLGGDPDAIRSDALPEDAVLQGANLLRNWLSERGAVFAE